MARSRDARLIARTRRGDNSAFEQLHARYQPAILSFCVHLTGSREDAEDAVQHTFLACYRWVRESEGALELKPWLFTVARNRCLSLLRARREDAAGGRELDVSLPDSLVAEVERRQELRDLVRDMARLPEPQRAALVLSQLDALSYREIGGVLDVPEQKVKALVYQARSSLGALREAREAPCFEVRQELATARGAARRRRLLRRHVGQCDGCREFEVAVMRQRHDLGALLPVAPSIGLGQAILGAIDRDATAAAGGAGGAAVGGSAGAGIGGTLAAIGLPGMAKLAVVAAIVGGGTTGALAADLPQRVEGVAAWHGEGREQVSRAGETTERRGADTKAPAGGGGERPPDERGSDERGGDSGDVSRGPRAVDAPENGDAPDNGDSKAAERQPEEGDSGASDADHAALPPGLAKRDELPPGLAKRETLPPGLAKRDDRAPGRSGRTPGKSGQQGNGNNGLSNGGNSPGDGNNGQGNGNSGQGQGTDNGRGNGSGNGNAGGQGQGNSGQGKGNGAGNGNGSGIPR